MQKKITIIFSVFLSLCAGFLLSGCRNDKKTDDAERLAEVKDSVPPIGFWADSLKLVETKVREGENFTGFLNRLGLSSSEALAVTQACDSVFDVTKMRAGATVWAYYGPEEINAAVPDDAAAAYSDAGAAGQKDSEAKARQKGNAGAEAEAGSSGEALDRADAHPTDSSRLMYAVYSVNDIDMTVFKTFDTVKVWRYSKPVDTLRTYADVTIHSSLWVDMTDAGHHPQLIADLSDIYAWTVDFFGLQENDRFRVLYDVKKCEGETIGTGNIYYAEFLRDSTVLPAIRFDQGDHGNLYWNEKGESMRKAFLKAPLKFSRISSGFSYARKHPVTGKVRPHTAVDYAAPAGTPVHSIGDGTVISAGWSGGGGNTVKIRHNSVYTTAYLHLSKYGKGIKAGVRVRQGDVIGYVGSTGVSTGPHLDFRVWKNGSPINPLKLESPPSEPIAKENAPALDSTRLSFRAILDSLVNN